MASKVFRELNNNDLADIRSIAIFHKLMLDKFVDIPVEVMLTCIGMED